MLGILLIACTPAEQQQNTVAVFSLAESIQSIAAQPANGFEVPEHSPLQLPAAHGTHPAQRLDIWSVLLWLQDASQQTFTAQFVIVRLAGQPGAPQRNSLWATHDIYSARLIVQDETGETHQAERVARGALSLAGVDSDHVWLEQWQMGFPRTGAEIKAEHADWALNMRWSEAIPPQALTLLPGFGSSGPVGYTQTPMAVAGQLQFDQKSIAVKGQAWFDHIWGNGLPLASGQLGVVRLRALLGDGTWLDCTQLRRRSGGGTPLGGCTLHHKGILHSLDRRAVDLSPRYALVERLPLEWTLRIPKIELSLRAYVQPESATDDSLIALPALIEGSVLGQTIQGKAWLELAGFERPDSS